MKLDEQTKIQLLKDEYLHIQSIIESFDEKSLTIKSWSISFSLVALAGAFASKSHYVFLVAGGSSLLFWTIDCYWKRFQFAHYERAKLIERFFKGEKIKIQPMQIGVSWTKGIKKKKDKKDYLLIFWPHIMLPHSIILIAGIALFFMSQYGVFEF